MVIEPIPKAAEAAMAGIGVTAGDSDGPGIVSVEGSAAGVVPGAKVVGAHEPP